MEHIAFYHFPSDLKHIISDYVFHTIHKDKFAETLRNVRIRILDEDILDMSKEENIKHMQILQECTCCQSHQKDRPTILQPRDHNTYVIRVHKGLEYDISRIKSEGICRCKCRHLSRRIVRKYDIHGYAKYFNNRTSMINALLRGNYVVKEIKGIMDNRTDCDIQIFYIRIRIYLQILEVDMLQIRSEKLLLTKSLHDIIPNSVSPLLDQNTPNLEHVYTHFMDDMHEIIYDVKQYVREQDHSECRGDILRILQHL
jgi:hypothetical protein